MSPARMAPVDGARLARIGNEIWVADRELILLTGLKLPIRMVVLRGSGRRLLCYCPVAIDSGTREAVEGLGEVAWLIVPNRRHQLFLQQARRAFGNATVLGGDSPDGVGVALSQEGRLEGLADYRVVRVTRRFEEVVLYHDPSETLVVGDLIQNLPAADPRLKWWLKVHGDGAPPMALRRLLRLEGSPGLSSFYHWAMARPFRQISVAHGGVIREGARELVYRLFRP